MMPDLVAAVLDEAGKFANAVLAPLNRPGKDVTQNIVWVAPQGGEGPVYPNMYGQSP